MAYDSDAGVSLRDCEGCTIKNSTFFGNRVGVDLHRSNGNVLMWNDVFNNAEDGFRSSDCERNDIRGNVIRDNDGYGLALGEGDTGTMVIGNLFANNHGTSSEHHEDLSQASDDGTDNIWSLDGSTPDMGGNFWFDHSGPPDRSMDFMPSSYAIDGGQASDQRPLTRVPRTILPPPEALDMDVGQYRRDMVVSWERTGPISMIAVAEYRMYIDGQEHPVVIPSNAPGDVGGTIEERIPFFGVRNVHLKMTSVCSYGESMDSEVRSFEFDLDPPLMTGQEGFNGSFLDSGSFRLDLVMSDISDAPSLDVELDDRPIHLGEGYSEGAFGFWANMTGRSGNAINISIEARGLAQVQHRLVLLTWDAHGNFLRDEHWFFTDLYDPSVTITSPRSGNITRHDSVDLLWDSMDNGSGIERTIVGCNGVETVLWDRPGHLSLEEGHGLIEGWNDIKVTCIDRAGRSTEDAVSIKLDRVPPVLRVVSPRGDNVSLDAGILVLSDEPLLPDSVSVEFVGGEMTSLVSASGIALSPNGTMVTAALPFDLERDAVYHFRMAALDLAGNVRILEWQISTAPYDPSTLRYEVKGSVVDANGGPIVGAMISDDEGRLLGLTDRGGSYSIWISAGVHELTFEKEGYWTVTRMVVVSSDWPNIIGPVEMEGEGNDGPFDPLLIVMAVVGVMFMLLVLMGVLRRRRRSDPTEE